MWYGWIIQTKPSYVVVWLSKNIIKRKTSQCFKNRPVIPISRCTRNVQTLMNRLKASWPWTVSLVNIGIKTRHSSNIWIVISFLKDLFFEILFQINNNAYLLFSQNASKHNIFSYFYRVVIRGKYQAWFNDLST